MTPIRSLRTALIMAACGLLGAEAQAARPHFDASLAPRGGLAAAPGSRAGRPVIVHATEPSRGVPALLWAADPGPAVYAQWSPAEAARAQLLAHREAYAIPRAVIDEARVQFVHDTGRGGIVVGFRQQVGDVEVMHGDVKVLLDRQHRLIAIAGSPHPAAVLAAARPFGGSGQAAIAASLGDLVGRKFSAGDLVAAATPARAGSRYFELAPVSTPARGELRFRRPARVKPVYFPLGDTLVPAYSVEVQVHQSSTRPLDVYHYVIAADTGVVLLRADLTANESFTYLVWADEGGDGRPGDGPLQDFTPHPTGKPDVGPVEAVKPVLITIEGFNTNPAGVADPWLPPGSTETVGNNVDAYVDHHDPNGYEPDNGEFRATVTAPGQFALDYDIGAEPLSSQLQSEAALVQLFYTTNWLHDWWYDSGFNEGTGVAQMSNFGRGGVEGDPILAEGQDAALEGQLNNANMATPSDGSSPVMQMYLWSPRHNEGTLTLLPDGIEYEVAKASFGPLKFDLEAPLVFLTDDQGADPHDGCEAPTNDLAGAIALIHRGSCSFEAKTAAAEAAGAVGVIIANHQPAGLPSLGNDPEVDDPMIPVLGVSLDVGAMLEAASAGDATAHMVGTTDVMRDGTIDNMVIAHEFGHYLHHRLEDCGTAACGAMSEGWGDFNSLLMMLREGDPLDAVYAGVTYAGFDEFGYYGIRRVPYSVDFERNALTLRHIADGEALPNTHPVSLSGNSNSEVHNAGEIWATMMWEVYIALHKAHAGDMSFDEVRRLMSDYVVTGMLMTPHDATWTGQRDAILMAAAASSKDDFFTVAEAFARRGAGSCAVSPPADSTDFVGVHEDFALQANGALTAFTFDDSASSCDQDGVLDGGERGTIHVDLANGGAQPLPAGSVVTVHSPTDSLVFPNGATATIDALAALEATSVEFEVELIKGLSLDEHVTVKITLATPEGCTTEQELTLPVTLNGDIEEAAAAVDDVETPGSVKVWELAGNGAGAVWQRGPVGDGHAWLGADLGRVTDASLVTPPLKVSTTAALVVSFMHAYKFEYTDNTYWDGAVIEVSSDAGETWQDVAELVAIPYGGPIMSEKNPINGKMAFVDQNPAYPATEQLILDFGNKLAGKTVQLRFRIATDSAAGGPGWTIDDIGFAGIDNTPFPVWVPDQQACAGEETTTGAEESSSSSESGDESSGGAAIDDDGCGCRSDGGAGGRLAPLLLAGLALRRRRRNKPEGRG